MVLAATLFSKPMLIGSGVIVGALVLYMVYLIMSAGGGGGGSGGGRHGQGILVGRFPAKTARDVKVITLLNFRGMLGGRQELPRGSGFRTLDALLLVLDAEVPSVVLPNPEDQDYGQTLLLEHANLAALRDELSALEQDPDKLTLKLEPLVGPPSGEGPPGERTHEERVRAVADALSKPLLAPSFLQEVVLLVPALRELAERALSDGHSLGVRYQGEIKPGTPAGELDAAAMAGIDLSDYASVEPHLRVRLQSDALKGMKGPKGEAIELGFVYREDLPGTLTTLELDMPSSFRSVSREEAKAWDKEDDALFEVALANVAREHPLGEPEEVDVEGTKVHVYGGSPYVSAHALMIEQHEQLHGPEGTIFALPHRDAFLAMPRAELPEDPQELIQTLGAPLVVAAALFEQAQRPLRAEVYLRDPSGEVGMAMIGEPGEGPGPLPLPG